VRGKWKVESVESWAVKWLKKKRKIGRDDSVHLSLWNFADLDGYCWVGILNPGEFVLHEMSIIFNQGIVQHVRVSVQTTSRWGKRWTHLAPKCLFRTVYVSLRLLSNGVRIGLASAFSCLRICESREGLRGGLCIAVGGQSWEEELERVQSDLGCEFIGVSPRSSPSHYG
jgi:hypothetical protein